MNRITGNALDIYEPDAKLADIGQIATNSPTGAERTWGLRAPEAGELKLEAPAEFRVRFSGIIDSRILDFGENSFDHHFFAQKRGIHAALENEGKMMEMGLFCHLSEAFRLLSDLGCDIPISHCAVPPNAVARHYHS